jgi:hypothetical protein
MGLSQPILHLMNNTLDAEAMRKAGFSENVIERVLSKKQS